MKLKDYLKHLAEKPTLLTKPVTLSEIKSEDAYWEGRSDGMVALAKILLDEHADEIKD